ncbi:MAG: hypothetical protein D6695_10860 [Planctomycetota bacterium]|nr:MAG: hypothetical protein D6695_10860 [Planctomycetota bacterium]
MLGGCATGSLRPNEVLADRPEVVVEGDWDDVEAVLAGVLPRVRLVDEPPDVVSEQVYSCRVQTIDHGPGRVTLERLDGERIRIRVRIGRFGNPAYEDWVERALAARFEQLRGNVAAPIVIPPR